MSEAMTSESIIESEWILKGYWTRMRFAYQTPKGGWSDIDVLAYDPETKHLVISESKVRGSKKHIYAYTEHSKNEYGTILEYDDDRYFSFIRNLPDICKDGVVFSNFSKMVKLLTIQLVSNYVIAKNLKVEAETSVMDKVENLMPDSKTKLRIMLDTTLDVISRVIALENERGQGRRYGHPVLDIAREINRYTNPTVRYAGRSKAKTDHIKRQAIESFMLSIGATTT